jgi:hypothetical protein
MSNSRQTANNQFRNVKSKEQLSWDRFRDLLAAYFPSRDLSQPVNLKWARDFFESTNDAFRKAEIRGIVEVHESRPSATKTAERLQQIEQIALKLRELITGEEAAYEDYRPKLEKLSSESSHSIYYWMTHAIDRDANEFEWFVQALPEIAQRALLGREKTKAEERTKRERIRSQEGSEGVGHESAQKNKTSGATDEGPIPRGRPKDHFKDAFLIEILPVWEKFSDRAATFQSNPDTPTPCPFCDFCAKYLGDDSAEALAIRYRRALEEPLDIQ